MRILILGGYGVFGGRLARLLREQVGLTLIIAGRSPAKAEAFCAGLGGAASSTPLTLDRNGDLSAAFAIVRPDLVVDASGPFQAYGAAPYRVVEACLAQGCDYMDLADGAAFVAGIKTFDGEARAGGRVILSGVSTCPVLTASAVRELAEGFDRPPQVFAGIGPSPFSGVGLNVVRALTGYAGRPLTGRPGTALTETRTVTIAPPGWRPLSPRLFAVVDTPDAEILPSIFPGLGPVWFGAGPVPGLYLRFLVALAWAVKLRVLPSAGFLAPLGHWLMNHLAWGEHRGGMFVELIGEAGGGTLTRSWHLVAEGDNGPFIPAMAAAALIGRWMEGRKSDPGARHAANELSMADFQPLFDARAIHTGIREDMFSSQGLYPGILGSAFCRLPGLVRELHRAGDGAAFEGEANVHRGGGVLATFIAAFVGFPAAGSEVPLRVDFSVRNGVEKWTRTFGGRRFSSRQWAGKGKWRHLLVEGFGPANFAMALVVEGGRLNLALQAWRVFGIPMPRWLGPQISAHESIEQDRFRLFVEIRHPLAGLIVRYSGWLRRAV